MKRIKFDKLEDFLEQKPDYSNLVVHLTKSTDEKSENKVLCEILDSKTLEARNPYGICQYDFLSDDEARKRLKVVCFTETPLTHITWLLVDLPDREKTPEPYGLVFDKTFIRKSGGNPAIYLKKEFAEPLRKLFLRYKDSNLPRGIDKANLFRIIALVNICDFYNDWHWEREWRIAGNLQFQYKDVYCGICPEDEIESFEKKYKPIRFIDPYWGQVKLLDELVKQRTDEILF